MRPRQSVVSQGVRRDIELGAQSGQTRMGHAILLQYKDVAHLTNRASMAGKESPFAKFLTRFSKGDFIFRQGEEGDEMYIVQSGQVAIRKVIAGKRKTVNVLEKGDFFGEMSVLESLPRDADATAVAAAAAAVIVSSLTGCPANASPATESGARGT